MRVYISIGTYVQDQSKTMFVKCCKLDTDDGRKTME